MADSLHEIFAANLRIQCGRFPSIAHVCRGVPVNRQQFNKYLLGQNLPSPRVRRKLCEFFGVRDEDMFMPPDSVVLSTALRDHPSPSQREGATDLFESLRKLAPGNLPPSALRTGYYYCYFPMQNFENFLMRSIMRVSRQDGSTTFSRHTLFRSSAEPKTVVLKSRHMGVVFETAQDISLVGYCSAPAIHLSLLTFSKVQDAESGLLIGLALTRGTGKPFASKACMHFLGNKFSDGKRMLSASGLVEINDPSVHPTVVRAMKDDRRGMPSQIYATEYESLLISSQLMQTAAAKSPAAKSPADNDLLPA